MRNILTLFEKAIEIGLPWLGAVSGLGTLAYAITSMLLAQRRPTGQQTGAARKVLRTPYLVIATILFIALAYWLWKPLPLHLSGMVQIFLTLLGAIIMLPNLALYVWGLRTLGSNFNASSGFGVRLVQAHQLITYGPFAYLRHPMYLAVILACWGGLLLYRTWAMLLFAVMMFGLLYRGHREEEALAQAFESEWELYKQAVPGWFPRLKGVSRRDSH